MREGRYLEVLVGQLEHLFAQGALAVHSPEIIANRHTGDAVEVDVTLRGRIGSTDVLVALECRDRKHRQGVNWIRELATKRDDIGASAIVAVASCGFTKDAVAEAEARGVVLKQLSRLSQEEIAQSILGLHVDVFRPRYAFTGVQESAYRGFVMEVHDELPKLTQELLFDLASNPLSERIVDERDHKLISFGDMLMTANWMSAFSKPGNPDVRLTALITVPCLFVDEFGRERERYRLFTEPGKGIMFSRLVVQGEMWSEPEPAEISAVFDYSQSSGTLGRVAEVDLTPYGHPDKTFQVFMLSPSDHA